jgi:hypothetical protein
MRRRELVIDATSDDAQAIVGYIISGKEERARVTTKTMSRKGSMRLKT